MSVTTAGIGGYTTLFGSTFYLELGTGTTAYDKAQTTLVTPITDSGLARALATVTRVTTTETNDTVQCSYTWSSITGSKTLGEYGVFSASSSGTMYARRVLSPARSVVAGDTYTLLQKCKLGIV